MMIIRRVLPFVFILGIFARCVEPVDIESKEEINILTVEGHITTDFGPHNVRLSISAKYGSIFEAFPQRVVGASVAIRDDLGNVTFLNELQDGNYETPSDFRAEVGRSYSLLIETSDNKRYFSYPDRVNAAPKIDTVIYKYSEVPSENNLAPSSGFSILVQYQDNPETEDYYLFETQGLYELHTRPDLYTIRGPSGGKIPAPKDCCAICYVNEITNAIVLESDRLNDGLKVTKEISFLEDNGLRFDQNRYEAQPRILALSKEAYQYLSLIENQMSIDGDIFDPPPAQIRGNFINLDNPDEEVIGFFWAADVSENSLFLEASRLKNKKASVTIMDDCREVNGATTQFPTYW